MLDVRATPGSVAAASLMRKWDSRPPFTYGQTKAPYGEENSGGPDAATIVHHESLATLKTLHELLGER